MKKPPSRWGCESGRKNYAIRWKGCRSFARELRDGIIENLEDLVKCLWVSGFMLPVEYMPRIYWPANSTANSLLDFPMDSPPFAKILPRRRGGDNTKQSAPPGAANIWRGEEEPKHTKSVLILILTQGEADSKGKCPSVIGQSPEYISLE